MPTDETTLTLALVLTAGGAVVASALVTGLVQLVKQLGSIIDGKERIVAFILSAVLVVIAFAAGVSDGTLTVTAASAFAAFLAWYGIARLSMANYADVTKQVASLTGPTPKEAVKDAVVTAVAAEKADAREHAAVLATFEQKHETAGTVTR